MSVFRQEDDHLPDMQDGWKTVDDIDQAERLYLLFQRTGGKAFRRVHPLRAALRSDSDLRRFLSRAERDSGYLAWSGEANRWVWLRQAIKEFRERDMQTTGENGNRTRSRKQLAVPAYLVPDVTATRLTFDEKSLIILHAQRTPFYTKHSYTPKFYGLGGRFYFWALTAKKKGYIIVWGRYKEKYFRWKSDGIAYARDLVAERIAAHHDPLERWRRRYTQSQRIRRSPHTTDID